GRQAHALLAQQIDGPLAYGRVLDCCRKCEWPHAMRTFEPLPDPFAYCPILSTTILCGRSLINRDSGQPRWPRKSRCECGRSALQRAFSPQKQTRTACCAGAAGVRKRG